MRASLFSQSGGVENDIDRGGGPFGFVGMAGDVGFVNPDHVGVNLGDLLGQGLRQRHRHVGMVFVVRPALFSGTRRRL